MLVLTLYDVLGHLASPINILSRMILISTLYRLFFLDMSWKMRQLWASSPTILEQSACQHPILRIIGLTRQQPTVIMVSRPCLIVLHSSCLTSSLIWSNMWYPYARTYNFLLMILCWQENRCLSEPQILSSLTKWLHNVSLRLMMILLTPTLILHLFDLFAFRYHNLRIFEWIFLLRLHHQLFEPRLPSVFLRHLLLRLLTPLMLQNLLWTIQQLFSQTSLVRELYITRSGRQASGNGIPIS